MSSTSWIEEQYRPWRVPDLGMNVEVITARWAAWGSGYLGRASVLRDLQYGVTADERLDLCRPLQPNAPVVVFIHGGYWQSLDKDHYAFAMEPLVTAGALVASINYALCPAVSLDALVHQVRTACAWVWRHVRLHGGNPDHIVVVGHSAGGHLATMMAATDWPAIANDLPRDLIKAVVAVSGVFDLRPLLCSSINLAVRLDAESARRNSSVLLEPTHGIQMSVVVGSTETAEFRRQSSSFAKAWLRYCGAVAYIETSGHNHFQVVEAMLEADSALTGAILHHLRLGVSNDGIFKAPAG